MPHGRQPGLSKIGYCAPFCHPICRITECSRFTLRNTSQRRTATRGLPPGPIPPDSATSSAPTNCRTTRTRLAVKPGWTARWSTRWRSGRSSTDCAVRDVHLLDLADTTPFRRFTWRTAQWHRPGLEYLVSTDRHHGFESHEEELLLLAADFAADLVEALSQPFRLRFETVNGFEFHTPDYLLLTRRGHWLIDVRPAERIAPEDEVKFAASTEMALACGWNYTVVSGWKPHVTAVVDELSAGRRPLTDPLGLQGELLQIAGEGPISFGDLVEKCSLPAAARAHAIHLLWHQVLGMESFEPLCNATLIRRAPLRRSLELL